MEKAPGSQVTSVPCGCEVHLRQRRRSSRSASTTMTDLQRRLLAGKAGLLELALLRETQRRLIEEAVRQHRLESSNEEPRDNSRHLRSQSTVSDSTNDENRSWSAGEDSDEVFEPNVPEESRVNRPNQGSPTERTRLRCLSELRCRSRTSATSTPDRNHSDTLRRQRCRSEGAPDSSSRTLQLSEAYMRPLTVSGLTYEFPSPLHAVLTQFDLTGTGPTCPTTSSGNVGAVPTFLGTLEEMAFDESKTPKRLNSKRDSSFSIDEKTDFTKNEGVGTRRKPVCRQSQVVLSETDARVSELEGNFRENLDICAVEEDELSTKDIGPHENQSPVGKMATSEQFLSAEFSRSSCHRLTSEESDSDNNNNKKLLSQSSDDRMMGITEDDSPQKTSLSGLFLREEGYFSSNDSLTSIGPEPPLRKRRRGGPKATRPLCSEASFSDSLASDSCEDNNTPREIEKVDTETKTRILLLSDFDADDRAPIFC